MMIPLLFMTVLVKESKFYHSLAFIVCITLAPKKSGFFKKGLQLFFVGETNSECSLQHQEEIYRKKSLKKQ